MIIHADFPLLPIGSRRKATFFLKSRAGQFGKAHCGSPVPNLGPLPCSEAPAFPPRSSGEFEQSPLFEAPERRGGREQLSAPAGELADHVGLGLGWRSCKPRDSANCWRTHEAGRGKEALLTPGFQTSRLHNCETIHLCHLMPPSL